MHLLVVATLEQAGIRGRGYIERHGGLGWWTGGREREVGGVFDVAAPRNLTAGTLTCKKSSPANGSLGCCCRRPITGRPGPLSLSHWPALCTPGTPTWSVETAALLAAWMECSCEGC